MPPKRKGKGKGKGNGDPKNQNPPETETHREPSASASASAAAGIIPDQLLVDIIPDQLLVGILIRLPVKSLLRFKCVSNEWRTLTSLQTFISAHLSRAPSSLLIHAHTKPDLDPAGDADANKNVPDGHAIHIYRPSNPRSRSSIEDMDDFPGSGVVPFDYNLEVIGSTPNGIVCVAQEPFGENLTLWNPATRFSRSVSAPELKGDPELHRGVSIGLAYDPSQDDIKIVRMLCHKNIMNPPDEVEFYSLKSGVWTVMDPETIIPFSVRSLKCDAMFEGVPYWRCLIYEDRISAQVSMLVSFLPNKSVLDMEHFEMVLKKKDSVVRMGEIQGCLAAVSWEVLGRRKGTVQVLDVWLRYKTDGWKKLYRVDPMPMIGRVLGIYGERGIVLENEGGDGDLYMFRLKEMVLEDSVDTHDVYMPGSYWVLSYKESLVPIPEPGCSVI